MCLFQTSEQKYPMKISLETLCTNLFPRKLITCPVFHVRPTIADSPPIPAFLCYSEHLHLQTLDIWMLKKMCRFIIWLYTLFLLMDYAK